MHTLGQLETVDILDISTYYVFMAFQLASTPSPTKKWPQATAILDGSGRLHLVAF